MSLFFFLQLVMVLYQNFDKYPLVFPSCPHSSCTKIWISAVLCHSKQSSFAHTETWINVHFAFLNCSVLHQTLDSCPFVPFSSVLSCIRLWTVAHLCLSHLSFSCTRIGTVAQLCPCNLSFVLHQNGDNCPIVPF